MARNVRRTKVSTPVEAVTFDTVREVALKLPGVEDGTSYRTPALRVKTKFLARLREDGDSVAFRVGFDERDLLMRARPAVFFITEHYQGYPAVLLRLSAAERSDVMTIVEMAWRYAAPKRLVDERELTRRESAPRKTDDTGGIEMPFKSQAQRRKFAELLVKGEISAETFEEWNRETGSAELPDHVSTKGKKKSGAAKSSAKRKAVKTKAKTKPKSPRSRKRS